MLKRFRVSNFKSLLNVEFKPTGLNLLIGMNNAGKTNLCAALGFLSRTSYETLEVAAKNSIGETWNLPNAYVSDPTMEFEVDCSLCVDGQELDYSYILKIAAGRTVSPSETGLRVVEERLTLNGAGFDNVSLISSNGERVSVPLEGLPDGFETLAPSGCSTLSRLFEDSTRGCFKIFKDWLKSWSYYNLSPLSMRMPAVIRETDGLLSDGRNLSRMFYEIHNENPRLERRIIDIVKGLESKLDFFTFAVPDPESVYLFMEDEGHNRFSAQSISDGTLRFMAMTYIILAAGESRRKGLPAPLTIIEEPENGLYVGHLKPLIEQIDPTGIGGQFLFTTHSPYFIDLFDGNLEGVHLMKPGRPSSVLIKPDAKRVSGLLENMPLGEMHFREMLG